MGQKRIRVISDRSREKQAEKAKKEKKKSAKVPGLKGGQRVAAITSEPAGEEKPAKEEKLPGRAKTKHPPKKKGQPARGKRYQRLSAQVSPDKTYPLEEAVKLVKKTSPTRFEATVEVHLSLKKTATGLRGRLNLPHGSGKSLKVLVFGDTAKSADIVGDQELINQISSGSLPQVDIALATPEWMPKLAKVAKFLGPKGLMPNPRSGTVTTDPDKEIKRIKSGQVEYRTETQAPLIHLSIGKTGWEPKKITENLKALLKEVGVHQLTKVVLSSTMGPGIQVDFSQAVE